MTYPDPEHPILDPLLSEAAVARRYGRSIRSLQRWRARCIGPTWLQIGGSIFYRITDLLAFEARSRRGEDQ